MKAIVYHGQGDIRLENVAEPTIEAANDAIVRLTASAICGTDLHFIRGSFSGLEEGQILGHEGVGIVEETGKNVRNLKAGDRVVIPSTIACGTCSYCRASYYSKCDNANPVNPNSTAFFGGPKEAGGFRGLQAEYGRVPYANVGLVKIPDGVSDDDAILLSDIFPTAYFAADMASIKPGHVVLILGCGPVGQLAIASAKLFDAGRIIAVDAKKDRLEMAQAQGAETIDFAHEDVVETVREMTRGMGPDCVIDAVGVDAYSDPSTDETLFAAGDNPTQALEWAIEAVAKAGHVSVVGVYPPTVKNVPWGKAFGKNLTLRMGDCPHRRYLPKLLRLVANGTIVPSRLLSERTTMAEGVEAYKAFDQHQHGWMKVELLPQAAAIKGTVNDGNARLINP